MFIHVPHKASFVEWVRLTERVNGIRGSHPQTRQGKSVGRRRWLQEALLVLVSFTLRNRLPSSDWVKPAATRLQYLGQFAHYDSFLFPDKIISYLSVYHRLASIRGWSYQFVLGLDLAWNDAVSGEPSCERQVGSIPSCVYFLSRRFISAGIAL